MLIFFKINFFEKFFPELSECQTVWTQIMTDIMLVLIWVQTVCKNYQQTTKIATSKARKRIKGLKNKSDKIFLSSSVSELPYTIDM